VRRRFDFFRAVGVIVTVLAAYAMVLWLVKIATAAPPPSSTVTSPPEAPPPREVIDLGVLGRIAIAPPPAPAPARGGVGDCRCVTKLVFTEEYDRDGVRKFQFVKIDCCCGEDCHCVLSR
jgi:hypothetical protein